MGDPDALSATIQAEVDGELTALDQSQEMPPFLTWEDARDFLRTRFGYIANLGLIWDRHLRVVIKKSTLTEIMLHLMPMSGGEKPRRMAPVPALLADALSKFDVIEYNPGAAPTYKNEEGHKVLNTYVPPPFALTEGDVTPFLQHVLYLFDGDRAAAAIMLNYLAYLIQHPGKKMTWTPLHINKQEGTGRGLLFETIRRVLGARNVFSIDGARLTSRFNSWALNTQLLIVPELYLGVGNKDQRILWNLVKQIITDATMPVEGKGSNAISVPNRMNLLLASNHSDAVSITRHDRRLWVWTSKAAPLGPDYYAQQYKWIADLRNIAAIAGHLSKRDLVEFCPEGNAPHTAAREALVVQGRDGVEQYLREALDQGVAPFSSDLVSVKDIVDFLVPRRLGHATVNSVADLLVEMGAVRVNGGHAVRIRDVGSRHLWAVRPTPKGDPDGRRYTDMGGSELAEHYVLPPLSR